MKNKCRKGGKTLWENEKLLVTSNFSFSHNVFHRYISLVRQNVVLFCNGLTHYTTKVFNLLSTLWKYRHVYIINCHTIPTFNTSGKESFWKHFGKRRKCWLPAFSPFPTMFSILPNTNFYLWVTIILSSATTLNLDWFKILWFGTVKKHLKRTIWIWLGLSRTESYLGFLLECPWARHFRAPA